MPVPNAIVATIGRIGPTPERPAAEQLREGRELQVEFSDGSRALLQPGDPRAAGFAGLLEELQRRKRAVYVEVDPDSRAITRLLIPHDTRVVRIAPDAPGGVEFELAYSHARHVLRRDDPDFASLYASLRAAHEQQLRALVTEDEAHRLLDLRPVPGPDDGPTRGWPFRPEPQPLLDRLWRWRWWPWWWFGCVSMRTAQRMFDLCSATSCNPLTVPPPCIPFLYPDDGCWARAHEMCRLMIDAGTKPRKVWIEGSLHVLTKNNPYCEVFWGWHVAPTLCVRRYWWWPLATKMVIDPALFTGPVTEATWKGVQGDANAALYPHDASVYYRWSANNLETDPTYSKTWAYLQDYRLYLQNRSLQVGPPPYANCP